MTSVYPEIWGPCQLIAFSGLDGATDWSQPFVLHTGSAPGSLRVKLPATALIELDGGDPGAFSCILGDVIVAAHFTAVFADCHTLLGEAPAGARLIANGTRLTEQPAVIAVGMGLQLLAAQRDRRWTLLVRQPGEQVNIDALLTAKLAPLVEARRAFLDGVTLPAHLPLAQQRLLAKCISVMKVNAEAPSGCIRRRWSTPDRWPHRHMWLWDSAFHAIGMAGVDPAIAQDYLLAMLEQVQSDGFLPHTIRAGEAPSEITQPPILAWATLVVLERSEDLAWARECLPHLQAYLDWMRQHRDRNGNDIPEWEIEGEPLCRCGECGLDNSPVYDGAVLLDAPDFAAFLANDYRSLATIYRRLGQASEAEACSAHAERIGKAVNALLWQPERGFYFHREHNGSFVDIEAISGFMPLFGELATAEQAAALVEALEDPARFGAPLPVPSVALNSGSYCKDMWRGPSWYNLSYLVYLGLCRYGYDDAAATLRQRLLEAAERWYGATGCVWEYYDSLDLTSPGKLDRKQRLVHGEGIGPISDYHWTAAVIATLLLQPPSTTETRS